MICLSLSSSDHTIEARIFLFLRKFCQRCFFAFILVSTVAYGKSSIVDGSRISLKLIRDISYLFEESIHHIRQIIDELFCFLEIFFC